MLKLGVNIDHVATLREARRGTLPEPALAAAICQISGADSIVAHLREDRRHIKDEDVFLLKKTLRCRFNLEMSITGEIVDIACEVLPYQATLVPEKRQELTTEGGLDLLGNTRAIKQVIKKLDKAGIAVSLFIDPEKKQIDAAKKIGARIIELHTGRFAGAVKRKEKDEYLRELRLATAYAKGLGFAVNAGHGLDYSNAADVARIKGIGELNIGYSIICRSVMVGIAQAVREMKELIKTR
jgi:pyridoxine 5-phosphate synthase